MKKRTKRVFKPADYGTPSAHFDADEREQPAPRREQRQLNRQFGVHRHNLKIQRAKNVEAGRQLVAARQGRPLFRVNHKPGWAGGIARYVQDEAGNIKRLKRGR